MFRSGSGNSSSHRIVSMNQICLVSKQAQEVQNGVKYFLNLHSYLHNYAPGFFRDKYNVIETRLVLPGCFIVGY